MYNDVMKTIQCAHPHHHNAFMAICRLWMANGGVHVLLVSEPTEYAASYNKHVIYCLLYFILYIYIRIYIYKRIYIYIYVLMYILYMLYYICYNILYILYIYIYIMHIYVRSYVDVIFSNLYAIIKTMCSPGYHHNSFVATHVFGHMMPRCSSCHKVILVITGKAHCLKDCIYMDR